MVSVLVMLLTAILHVGFQTTLFVNMDQPIPVPGTLYASFMMYCGCLHFLQDAVLLPKDYKRRMPWLIRFAIELTLSIALMEVMALFIWTRLELIICLWVKAALYYFGRVAEADYDHHETIIVGTLVTSLAALFWTSAIMATEGSEEEQSETKGKSLPKVGKEEQQQQEFEQLNEQRNYQILAGAETLSSET